ncbi:glycosyltransferase family 2 protein [Paenibacillus sp. alder61]|uniref:Glycosyltransferase family 2 protein n=1 Tax=Paenibacillus faecis TaxID=862114 RepID=A0A5D0CT33_9BACL|nr:MULTISPECIES: glycosyltransferase family 2 protein [Paenibacillus]MCA1294102.1 glycosyltransferase family 2 protein [Paenibacillus sp. alder61]TYA11977.1 glycosyltransferase family 2 protein [Paenibacillus faecis]
MKTLIIIPAYNEEGSIAGVIQDIHRHAPKADVIVVNDGSTDRTAELAAAAGAKVLTLPYNVGIGGGMQTGYLYAQRMGYDIAVQMDADGQHPAEELPKLIAKAREADLVIGSRYVETTSYRSSRMRRAGMVFFSGLVSLVTGQRFTDTTSGFRAAGRKVIELYAAYYPIDYPEVESIVYLKRKGCRITEVATEMHHRKAGKSSITPWKSVYYMVKVTLAVLMSAIRYDRGPAVSKL